jgi:hypothetical protein
MPPAIAIAGAAVVGAGATMIAGSKAAKAQKQAADQATAEQRREYEQDRTDLAPYRAVGTSALDKLSKAYGLNGNAVVTGSPTNADGSANADAYGGFFTSPGYEFRRDEGVKAVQRSQVARGALGSGATMKAIERYAEGNAASEYGAWSDRLMQMAGIGQNATNTTVAAGQNAATNISNNLIASGNARASSYSNAGSAINSGLNNVMSAYLMQNMFKAAPAGGRV